jgi:hypothetical protein
MEGDLVITLSGTWKDRPALVRELLIEYFEIEEISSEACNEEIGSALTSLRGGHSDGPVRVSVFRNQAESIGYRLVIE